MLFTSYTIYRVKMSLSRNLVTVINLGRMGFLAAADLQKRYAREHLDFLAGKPGAISRNVILLVEHDPVYTTGFRTKTYTEEEAQRLKSLGADFYRTNRGGMITFHGPGQLVAYPILNLLQFRPSVKWYVSSLEATLIKTCANWGIAAKTTVDTGVWVEDRKIGAIGIHTRRYVTTHGISLNCNPELSWFKFIIPCELKGKSVTSISQEINQEISIKDVTKSFLESFSEVFNCSIETSMLEKHEHIFIPHQTTFSSQNASATTTPTPATSTEFASKTIVPPETLYRLPSKEKETPVDRQIPMW
ncbi:putative lipoyltransferase 2, mitochondrial isoform X2 [Octopus bimaculoides]|uniref:putative lipoyltransferase 2, mitochondrial isoform X2 n=1 Tax=Octopus bimaculoides TaxID=37653 RepID=UPI0022E785EC|nr:putative lipoyltransferase 2, mitochondrial isoform X2 [Octopus bimaculoides]